MRRLPAAVVGLGLLVVLSACGGEGVTVDESTTVTTASPPVDVPEATTTTTTLVPATTVAPEDVPPAEPAAGLGDDADLDRLAEACAAGQFGSCDTLFFNSPPGSDYEAYGDTCGGRNEPGALCTDIYGRGTEPGP